MPRGNHTQSIASNGEDKNYHSAHNVASMVGFSMEASADDSDHGCVVRIFTSGAFVRLLATNVDRASWPN